MLKIHCPHCGERNETEFSYGGEADILRPKDPAALSDAAWAEYVFFRKNTMGQLKELWHHAHGCRKWFSITRNTLTNEIQS
ncbi:MAG: sarcosine oxidase subunit delta [Gammaproteobacteria bacterium]|nr:sarcosine oxidase subunit delta [Gammaproteobacteria bacterium]